MPENASVDWLLRAAIRLADEVRLPHGDEVYDRYLRWFAKLHRYSATNVLLIVGQCPQASYVASYRRWEALGRTVRRGETGIPIVRPKFSRSAFGNGWYRSGWGIGYVFDASQTTGDTPIPEYKLQFDDDAVPRLLQAALDFTEAEGIDAAPLPIYGHQNGISQVGRILLNSLRPESVQLQTLFHELGHELLHGLPRRAGGNRAVLEAEAEAVAVVCLSALGFETVSNGAAYIRHHLGKPEHVLHALNDIAKAAHQILEGISQHLPLSHPTSTADNYCGLVAAAQEPHLHK